jgi:outer membrane protein assembly factor BamB
MPAWQPKHTKARSSNACAATLCVRRSASSGCRSRRRAGCATSWDSWFYAIDAAPGKERWRFHGGEDALVHNQVGFQSSPAVVDGVVYTGCRDANVYALDAKTGAQRWKVYHDGSWVNSTSAVAGGKMYCATSDSALYKVVDGATGKADVQEQGNSWVFSSPAVAGDVVVIGVGNGSLEARDRASGKLL